MASSRDATVLVVVARWYTDLIVIFITSVVLCTAMIENELIESFSKKTIYPVPKRKTFD